MPTATVLTSTGKKTIERSSVREPDPRRQQHRQQQTEHDLEAARHDGIDDRVAQSVGQRRFLKNCSKFSKPIHSQSNRVQRVRLKKKREQRRARGRRRRRRPLPADRTSGDTPRYVLGRDWLHGRLVRAVGDDIPGPAGRTGPDGALGGGIQRSYQPSSPSCLACFSTSSSYVAAPSSAARGPDPTSTVICASDGPLTGDRNSSAGRLRAAVDVRLHVLHDRAARRPGSVSP